jgi:glyoxylase-like metal-dependent hydrolase (beta-lactamase superfamily II)
VLIDTGSFLLAERTRQVLRNATAAPVHTAVWTHGHVDHCFGVELYEREAGRRVRVIAHEGVSRRYRLTQGKAGPKAAITLDAAAIARAVASSD